MQNNLKFQQDWPLMANLIEGQKIEQMGVYMKEQKYIYKII